MNVNDNLEILFDAGVASNKPTEINYTSIGFGSFIERNLDVIKGTFKLLNDKEYVKKYLEW